MSTIPNHPVASCRYIHTRFSIFDELCDTIFRNGPIAARQTIAAFPNSDRILQEFDYFAKGENCCTCFWKLLYDKYSENAKPVDTNGWFYFEVVGDREAIDDERSIQRLMKQKTDPIEEYIYEIVGDDQCRVSCAYKPMHKSRMLSRTIERAFPEGSDVNNKKDISQGKLRQLMVSRVAVRGGKEA